MLRVLGLESSCDDTSAGVVRSDGVILSNLVYSQINEHIPYMGVMPDIAARAHLAHFPELISHALRVANVEIEDLDGIAATAGPGLIGGVMIGTMFAKTIASIFNKPYVAVNHLEAHALSSRIIDKAVKYPYLLLLVSGGHCQFIVVENFKQYKVIGTTLDDALGEAFDKVAKMLNIGYPGGAMIEVAAQNGDPYRYNLPLSMIDKDGCNMSFSGLKTATRLAIERNKVVESRDAIWDLAASFQYTICAILAKRTANAIKIFNEMQNDRFLNKQFVLSGGVAANLEVRKTLERVAIENGFTFHVPPKDLCTDNAAMVAWVGIESMERGIVNTLDFSPQAKWSIDAS